VGKYSKDKQGSSGTRAYSFGNKQSEVKQGLGYSVCATQDQSDRLYRTELVSR
jgi:hypothetical protein